MASKTTHSFAASFSLVLLVLSCVSAVPLAREQPTGGAISLPPRAAPTNPDGTFNHDAAKRLNRKVIEKHRQNLMNLEKNCGGLPEGIKIPDLAAVPQNPAHVPRTDEDSNDKVTHTKRTSKKAEEGLTDEEGDVEWAGNIEIGTPSKKFLIDFDTGSSDLWVVASSCTDGPCAKKNKYDVAKSSTSKKETGTFSIVYGDNSTVSGPISSDTVTVAGATAMNQTFSAVTTLSTSFADDPTDGILGLAWPAISNLKAKPWFLNAAEQGAVKKKEFGFYLTSGNGSQLYLGGTDPELYSGSLEYHKVDPSEGFWKVLDARIHVGGKEAVKDFQTIIDSGTTLMYGPPAAVKEFFSKVDGASVYDEQEGFYSFPCDKVPKVSFSWGAHGKNFAVPSENFNLGQTEKGSSSCVASLAASDLGLGNAWLIGDSFMKGVYAGFRFGEKDITKDAAVGFAELKKKK
ncbi:acid protease [Lentinula detonsa]|uniref:Acid protease n=1 Tax=Lentinula detonsa TaxID=2804962 RepID=A0A9W8PC39_9AGAR|nr:acid protease [Lentinula detonsa]